MITRRPARLWLEEAVVDHVEPDDRERSPGQAGLGEQGRPDPRCGAALPDSTSRCAALVTRCGAYALGVGTVGALTGASFSPCSKCGSHSSQLRQVPVPVPEQLHRRREEDRPDDRRVDQDRHGQADAELLEHQHRERREDGEDAHHHDRSARDDAGCRLDPVGDGLVGAHPPVVRLANAAEDEDVVVHRQAEQDHEEEDREERVDSARELEAQKPLPPAVLEHEHEDTVGGPDREQVEQDRLGRDHHRPEGKEHQAEREQEHEPEHERRDGLHLVVVVLRLRGRAGDGDLGIRQGPQRRRDHLVA